MPRISSVWSNLDVPSSFYVIFEMGCSEIQELLEDIEDFETVAEMRDVSRQSA